MLTHVDEIRQDLRDGFRQLSRAPAFAGAVVLLLALGIGLNTATFSVVKNVLLEPLPFRSPEQLVIIWRVDKGERRIPESAPVSGPNFLDWRRESRSFERLVAFAPESVNMTGRGDPERIQGTATTAGLFELLGVQPALGRTFRPDEERHGQHRVAVVSDGFWRTRLGADPRALGRSLTLDGEAYTIVGVMPPGFQHPCPWSAGKPTDVWVPLSLDKLEVHRDWNRFLAQGRLKSGVTVDAAQAEMDLISERLEQAYPDANKNSAARIVPTRQVLVGRFVRRLWMLLGASVLMLLVVGTNVAGLFMARAMRRQIEIAIRAGLGASRSRLVRQFVTESLPLFLVGGAASVLVAEAATGLLRAIMPPTIPRIQEIKVDGWILSATLLLSLLVGFVSSAVPALAASHRSLSEALSQGRGSSVAGRSGGRRLLVVAQVALTLVLANGAGLMLRSYWTLRTMDLGFSTEGVLTMRLDLSGPRYAEPDRIGAFFEESVRRIETLPGVRRAAAVNRLPLEGGTNRWATIEGRETGPSGGPLVELKAVTPGYLETIGIPLLAGRDLTERDGMANLSVAVINHTMAGRFWPGQDPIGKRFRFKQEPWVKVVGVAGDTRQWGMERNPLPEAYFPYQVSPPDLRFLVIRTFVEPMSMVAVVRREIARVDKDQPVSNIRTTAGLVDASIAERRFGTLLVGLFASTALVLVAAAIYALMSFFVAERTQEIGVRIALGATPSGVLRLVLRRAVTLAGMGVAMGLLGVAAATRLVGGLVYGISPNDPATIAAGVLGLVAIGLLGSLVPALRATRIDPVTALRAE
jgi:putative ABC transport system permease protein